MEGQAYRDPREAIEAIAASLLAAPLPTNLDASLASGHSGLALFHAYAAAYFHSEAHRDRAELHAVAAGELADALVDVGLYSGLAGVGWCLSHLASEFELEVDLSALDDLDESILELLRHAAPDSLEFDLTRGLSGIAVYAAERGQGDVIRQIYGLIYQRLAESAIHDPRGTFWRRRLAWMPAHVRNRFSDGAIDLGLAHGTPGVIGTLALVAQHLSHPNAARHLVSGAIEWMRTQRRGGLHPARIAHDDMVTMPDRNAWCYGELGIAAAMSLAADIFGEGRWKEYTISSLITQDDLLNGITDPTLCHGAGGALQILNRLMSRHREPRLELLHRATLRQLLGFRNLSFLGGFSTRAIRSDNIEEVWAENTTLLLGTAGIGLALISELRPDLSGWDRVLMISRSS